MSELPGDEVMYHEDPRWVYDLTPEQAYAGWSCGECGVRRGEHADQLDKTFDKFPELDITDHKFVYSATLSKNAGDET